MSPNTSQPGRMTSKQGPIEKTESGNYDFQKYRDAEMAKNGPRQDSIQKNDTGNYNFQNYKSAQAPGSSGVKVPPVQNKLGKAQPGRIPPVKAGGKTIPSTGSSKISNVASVGIQVAAKALPKPAKEAIDVGVGMAAGSALVPVLGAAPVIVGKMIDARIASQNREGIQDLRRSLDATGKGRVPKTKKRITTLGQIVFIGFAVIVDVTEGILDCFAVGVVVNRIIDIIVGLIFLVYGLFKGLSLADNWAVFESTVATIAGEFVPFLDALPFFTADAWFITHTIKRKDRAKQAALNRQAEELLREKERQNWIEEYERERQQEQKNRARTEQSEENQENNETAQENSEEQNTHSTAEPGNYSFQKYKDKQELGQSAKTAPAQNTVQPMREAA